MSEPEQHSTWEWHFLTKYPPRELKFPRYMDMFRRQVEQASEGRPGFEERLRQAALYAIEQEHDVTLVRQGLQCLAHVGLLPDIPAIERLEEHPDSQVARESKTCVFEIRNTPRHLRDS